MRVLTFNSFPGSPLPYLWNGTPGIGQTSRLGDQIKELQTLSYDVACFQEIFSQKTVQSYRRMHAEKGFEILGTPHVWRLSRCVLGTCIRLLFSAAINIPTWLVLSMGTHLDSQTCFNLFLFFLALGYAYVHVYLHEWTLIAFSSSIADAGLFTCYRKSLFELIETYTIELARTGDLMNFVQPRLCLMCRLRCKRSGITLCVANTHLNALGSSQNRLRQIKAILHAFEHNSDDIHILAGDLNIGPSSAEFQYLCSQRWIDTAMQIDASEVQPTWSDKNTLTRGWLRSPSCRLDFILFRYKYDSECFRFSIKYNTVMKGLSHKGSNLESSDHYGVLVNFHDSTRCS